MFDACLFVEELAYIQIPVGSFAVTLIVAHIYMNFGAEDLKKQILGDVVAGCATAIAIGADLYAWCGDPPDRHHGR